MKGKKTELKIEEKQQAIAWALGCVSALEAVVVCQE